MYPMCMQLIRCAQTITNRCDDVDKQLHYRKIDRTILDTYEIYKKDNKVLRGNINEIEVILNDGQLVAKNATSLAEENSAD